MIARLLLVPSAVPLRRIALALALVLGLVAPAAAGFSWGQVADEVAVALDAVVAAYRDGDERGAKRALTEAYFGVFEGRKMEAALRKTLGQTHTFEVERAFSALRRMIGNQPADDVAEKAAALSERLRADAGDLDAAGVPEEVYNAR